MSDFARGEPVEHPEHGRGQFVRDDYRYTGSALVAFAGSDWNPDLPDDDQPYMWLAVRPTDLRRAER